jgi:hypothetical protein
MTWELVTISWESHTVSIQPLFMSLVCLEIIESALGPVNMSWGACQHVLGAC